MGRMGVLFKAGRRAGWVYFVEGVMGEVGDRLAGVVVSLGPYYYIPG